MKLVIKLIVMCCLLAGCDTVQETLRIDIVEKMLGLELPYSSELLVEEDQYVDFIGDGRTLLIIRVPEDFMESIECNALDGFAVIADIPYDDFSHEFIIKHLDPSQPSCVKVMREEGSYERVVIQGRIIFVEWLIS